MGAPYYVIPTGGQSNGQGGKPLDPAIDQVEHPRIWAYRQGNGTIEPAVEPLAKVGVPVDYNGMGPMLPFARVVIESGLFRFPDTHDILLVHGNVAGSTFVDNNWNPGDAIYEAWITDLTAAMATHASTARFTVVTICPLAPIPRQP